jgi:hypothetical protein
MLETIPHPSGIVTLEERVVERKPKRHRYGAIIGHEVDPFRRCKIYFESGLERNWLQVLIASPSVADIREQRLLEVVMPDGLTVKQHYFDYVVEWTDGTVSANACKYERDIDDDLTGLLEQAAATVGTDFADRYVLLSEVGLSERRIANARWVIKCGKMHDYPAQQAIREALPSFGSVVSLALLDAIVGEGDRGSNAAIAMIQQGVFGVGSGGWLGHVTELRNLFTK